MTRIFQSALYDEADNRESKLLCRMEWLEIYVKKNKIEVPGNVPNESAIMLYDEVVSEWEHGTEEETQNHRTNVLHESSLTFGYRSEADQREGKLLRRLKWLEIYVNKTKIKAPGNVPKKFAIMLYAEVVSEWKHETKKKTQNHREGILDGTLLELEEAFAGTLAGQEVGTKAGLEDKELASVGKKIEGLKSKLKRAVEGMEEGVYRCHFERAFRGDYTAYIPEQETL